MKKILILDMNNGDVFLKFGDEYAHIYTKNNDVNSIVEDVNNYMNGESAELWDNNHIDYWKDAFEDSTTELMVLTKD